MLHGDLVMARTTIKSNKANNEVARVCYAVRGSFQIIRDTCHGGYIVRKLIKSDSPEFKFMSEDLYILPPLLRPCKNLDGSDTRYLNQSHTPIVNPLKKPLNIELYNEKWFGTPFPTFSPIFKHDHVILSFPPQLQIPSLVFPTFITK